MISRPRCNPPCDNMMMNIPNPVQGFGRCNVQRGLYFLESSDYLFDNEQCDYRERFYLGDSFLKNERNLYTKEILCNMFHTFINDSFE